MRIDGHLGCMKGLILSINVKLSASVLLPVLLSFFTMSCHSDSRNDTVQWRDDPAFVLNDGALRVHLDTLLGSGQLETDSEENIISLSVDERLSQIDMSIPL